MIPLRRGITFDENPVGKIERRKSFHMQHLKDEDIFSTMYYFSHGAQKRGLKISPSLSSHASKRSTSDIRESQQ